MAEILIPAFREECLLSKGLEIKDLIKVRRETILYVQPCASERGKLMADVELRGGATEFINPDKLCSLLEIHRRRFAELKCSSSLGVAKLKWRGKEISIFKNGKLKIQRALDREEIMKIANSTARLIWGASQCELCGRPVLDCASRECGKCAFGEGEPLLIEGIPNVQLLQQARASLERARAAPQEAEKSLYTARYLALYFTVEAQRKEDAALGLVLLGEAERMKPASDITGHL